MKVTEEQQQIIAQEWLAILGQPPENRKPDDMTGPEIADLWKINQTAVYKLYEEGKLTKHKVWDEAAGRSTIIYRPVAMVSGVHGEDESREG